MIEALEHDDNYQGKVLELDANLKPVSTKWLDYDFSSDSKGFEGAAVVRHKGDLLLLALCEGNHCEGGDEGRDTGHGRIQVFKQRKKFWKHIGKIKLPEEMDFEDYADICHTRQTRRNRFTGLLRLWVAKVDLASSKISGKGQVYRFPWIKMTSVFIAMSKAWIG